MLTDRRLKWKRLYVPVYVEPQGDLQNEIVLKFKASAGLNQWNIRSQKQMGLFMSPASPSPSSWKTRMQINQFHSNFSYKNVCKQPLNMEWQAPEEFGKARFWRSGFVRRLKQSCNWESCFLWLLPCSINWEKWLFLVLFLVVCALLPQLVIHSCFARSFSKQQTNRLNLFQAKSILGAQLPEFWWEKGFLCMFLCSSPFQNCDIKIQY